MVDGIKAARKRQARRSRKTTEAREQRAVVAWLRNRDIWFTHPANENADARQRSINSAMGVENGVPDLLIFSEVPGRPEIPGVAIEMKKQGEKPDPDQRKWLERLQSRGWLAYYCCSAAEAIKVLVDLGF